MLSGKKFQLDDKHPKHFDLRQSLNALHNKLSIQELILDNGGESVSSKGRETLSLDFLQLQNLYHTLLHSGEKFTIEYLSNWHERGKNDALLFSESYKPQSLSEMCGNREQIREMRAWMNNWLRGKERKPILIHGPPGIGKTTSVELLAKEFGFELVEYDSSDNRSKKSIEELQEKIVSRIVGCHDTAAFLKHREAKPLKKLIFMDEIDGISGSGDRGGLAALKNLLGSIGKGFSKFNNSVPI